jgi:hypothetical protein
VLTRSPGGALAARMFSLSASTISPDQRSVIGNGAKKLPR